jgi:hypothetical protein
MSNLIRCNIAVYAMAPRAKPAGRRRRPQSWGEHRGRRQAVATWAEALTASIPYGQNPSRAYDLTHSWDCSIVSRRKPSISISISAFAHVKAYSRSGPLRPGFRFSSARISVKRLRRGTLAAGTVCLRRAAQGLAQGETNSRPAT